MNIKKNKTFLIAAFVFVTLGLIYFIGVTYVELKSAFKESDKIKTSIYKLALLEKIQSDIQYVEAYQYSFIIDNNEKYIFNFEQTEKDIQKNIVDLENAIASDADEKRNFEVLKLSINKNLRYMQEAISTRINLGHDAANKIVSSGRGMELMKDFKNQINNFKKSNIIQIENSNSINNSLLNNRFLLINIGYGLSVLFFGIMFFWVFRELKKLRFRERLLKYNNSILLNIYDPVITTDKNFIITDWNNYAEELLGYNKSEAIGVQLSILLKTIFENSNIEDVRSKIKTDKKWNGNLTYISKSGTPIYVNASTSHFYDEHNEIIGTVTVIRNISKQIDIQKNLENISLNLEKEVESKISEIKLMNTRFELMMEATDDAIWDMEFGSDKIWGNKKYLSYFNKIVDEHIFYVDLQNRIHPDDLLILNDAFSNALIKKETNFTIKYRFKNNEENWLTLLNKSIIIYNKNNEPIRLIGNVQDITKEEEIKQQIINEKEISDALINSLPGIFYMFNKKGEYIRWNENIFAITGYNKEDMTSLNPILFVPEEQRSYLIEKINGVFEKGSDSIEADLLTKDGRRIPYYFTGIYIKMGDQDCMMGVGIDISERVKIQQELRHLATDLQNIREEERTRISREIHDELGQQLTGLKMNISWLNKKLSNTTPEISNHINQSIALSDQTLKTVRRIAAQLRPSILDDLGLISALEWESDEFQNRYNIETNFVAENIKSTIDQKISTAIFRIFQESLTNILRHSKATLVITVLSELPNQFSFKIEDNGIGFDENTEKKISTLGLLGMKERASMIGGTLTIKSTPNKGTILFLQIPKNNIQNA
jgi:PAS domain S-box-containing protein